MKKSIERRVIEEFNKQKVNYCILRNYEKLESSKDIDILLDLKDGLKVRNILKKFNYTKGFFLGDKKFDIKPGCMEFGNYYLEDAKDVLKRKRKKDYFYILGEEDELKHLILKSLGNKFSKKEYLKKIESLIKSLDEKKIKIMFEKDFGKIGIELINLIIKKKYGEAYKLKDKFYRNLKSPIKKLKYLFCRLSYPLLKR